MNAKELMIGNYVLDRGNKILRIDYWECKNKIAQDMGSYLCEPFGNVPYHPLTEEVGFLKPITLKEQWLLDLGFRKSNDRLYFLPIPNLSMEIHAVYFRECWLIELANDRKNIVTEALNVHQLQNLYFALTNQQLTIKK